MPYVTQIPASLITVGVDGNLTYVPNTSLLNAFDVSQEFQQYDVDATSGTTLSNGDAIATVDGDGNTIASGTYLGSAEISNAAVSVGIPLLASVSLQVNPISGQIFEGDDSEYYFISDEPVDDDHLQVTASITVAGIPVSVTGPISGITEQLAQAVQNNVPIVGGTAAATIRGTADLLQNTANTAIVTLDHDDAGTLTLEDDEVVPCFVRGTLIETEMGSVAVELLRLGVMVVTRDHGLQPVRWIGCARLDADALHKKAKLYPIRIRAGALGENTPAYDLTVSPQHRILVRSKVAVRMFGAEEILVAAKQLLTIDGIDVVDDIDEVEYFHFLCDEHEVVYSNGAATETMHTGEQALNAVGAAAREEIFSIFPQLKDREVLRETARIIPSGKRARRLVSRHVQNGRELFGSF
ncbi:MAG: hemolysin [Paracoccus sp.]|nr:MAG: hemolysin [Paracoccus sp. (in: a-proteobacteria)]